MGMAFSLDERQILSAGMPPFSKKQNAVREILAPCTALITAQTGEMLSFLGEQIELFLSRRNNHILFHRVDLGFVYRINNLLIIRVFPGLY